MPVGKGGKLGLNMLECVKYLAHNIENVTAESFVLSLRKPFDDLSTTQQIEIIRNLLPGKMSVDRLL
jgi:hypothetical protein